MDLQGKDKVFAGRVERRFSDVSSQKPELPFVFRHPWRWVLESWWMGPVLFLALFLGAVAVIFALSLGHFGREGYRAMAHAGFYLFWSARVVSLLLPVWIAVQLARKQERIAWKNSVFSAIVLLLAGAFEFWLSGLPAPPHSRSGRFYALACTVLFAMGMASALSLGLAAVVPLFRKQRKRAWRGVLCSAVVLPPFLWYLCAMTDAWPWIVARVWQLTGWRLPL